MLKLSSHCKDIFALLNGMLKENDVTDNILGLSHADEHLVCNGCVKFLGWFFGKSKVTREVLTAVLVQEAQVKNSKQKLSGC